MYFLRIGLVNLDLGINVKYVKVKDRVVVKYRR